MNDLGLSVGEVADAAGLSEAMIYKMRRGDRMPSRIAIARLAEVIQVPPEQLFSLSFDAAPQEVST